MKVMEYEAFKNAVVDNMKSYLPESCQNVQLNQVCKVNRSLDALSFTVEVKASPVIYVNDMYEEYLKTGNMSLVLQNAAELMVSSMENAMDCFSSLSQNEIKNNILFQLVNTEQNKEMLAERPHREYLDLSIVYYWVQNMDANGFQSAAIDNKIAKWLGVDEEELFRYAAKNTKQLLPPVVKDIREILTGMMGEEFTLSMEDEIADNMLIISNSSGIRGAASILYEDILYQAATELGTDELYILPSSIHECIAVPVKSDADAYELAALVSCVNEQDVHLEDRLSNQVYYYNRGLRKVSLATDTLNKRLD